MNKLAAIALGLFLLLVPFRMAYLDNVIIDSPKYVFYFLTVLFGFFAITWLIEDEPIGRKRRMANMKKDEQETTDFRKAA